MTLLYFDGFDHYATAQLAAKGWTVGSSTTIAAVGRTGANGLQFGQAGSYVKRGVAVADEHATLIAGVALNPSVLNDARPVFSFQSDNGATTHVSIEVSSTGAIIARRGNNGNGTLLGTSSAGVVISGAYQYIEALVTLSDTVGVVTVHVNGASVLSLTGQDTKSSGTKTVLDTVLIGTVNALVTVVNGTWDDVYICNGAGSAPNNTFLGDVRVRTLMPTGNGNSSQLVGSDSNSTDNYALVDEVPPDTADYVGSATTGDKDTYAAANLAEVTGTVFGVQQLAYALKTDAGSRSLATVVRSNGTDYDSSDLALATTVQYIRSLRETDPDTAAAWTIAGVNAAEFGVKVRP